MNEVLQNIMTFINENTLLLIGICVFLILVLIGYLIDNSVKSKRVRNDIKNKDQVPDKIKDEIIKEAEAKGEVKKPEEVVENINTQDTNIQEATVSTPVVEPEEVKVESNVNEVSQSDSLNSALDLSSTNMEVQNDALDNALNLDSSLKVEDNNLDNLIGDNFQNNNINENINLTDKQADTLDFGIDSNILSNSVETPVDPDAFIMAVVNEDNEYKNDKKLSEILSFAETNTLNVQETSNSNETPLNIEANNEVSNSPQDELDQIMKKLSSLKGDTEEDNYTNIF